jgi:glycosyltransferase involved in cell wall biosynthesis
VSDVQRETLIRRFRLKPARIMTIVNGVTANPFLADPRVVERKRAELGLSLRDPVVGTIAVLTEQKGISDLLAAARTVLTEHPRVQFLVVGGGRLEEHLRREADNLGLGGRVRFTGWRSDAAEILTALDIFVMPSLWEAMPMALLEAMAARRSIIVSDVGENRAVLANGRCGVVVPPRDPRSLSMAIGQLLSDPARAASLSEAAQHYFRLRFSVDLMISAYEGLYSAVLETRSSGRWQAAARSAE